MKNIFSALFFLLFAVLCDAQDAVTQKINSHIRTANPKQQITKDTLAGVLELLNEKTKTLDSANWKMGGNIGGAAGTYRLTLNVPRQSSPRRVRSLLFGFNADSVNNPDAQYGIMRLTNMGTLSISANNPYNSSSVEIAGTTIKSGSNWVGGERFRFAESEILNGEISGFRHRIIPKEGINQYFHSILFAQGLGAIQTGTSQVWINSTYGTQDKGSILIDAETGVGYIKKREGVGIETYNRIVTSRTSYTPTSTNDPAGEVGDTAQDESFYYTKTATGWKRVFLGTF